MCLLCVHVSLKKTMAYKNVGSNNGLAYSERIINYAGKLKILSVTCSFPPSHYAEIQIHKRK